MNFDHILVIGFGGVEHPEDLAAFLERTTRGRPIPAARLDEVRKHYERIGGISPYNAGVRSLVSQIENELQQLGLDVPVFTGMRNWHPFLKDTVAEIKGRGLKRGAGIILSPFRSPASCRRYKEDAGEACQEAGAEDIEYVFFNHWAKQELHVKAMREVIEAVFEKDETLRKGTVVFCAHSIPLEMIASCDHCRYDREFEILSNRVAEQLGLDKWHLAYQSRSGHPSKPWLGPDILSSLQSLSGQGEDTVILVPAGFFIDNAEIIYDLDVEAREKAESLGMRYERAAALMHSPLLARMFVQAIKDFASEVRTHAVTPC